MDTLLFGTAGSPASTPQSGSEAAVRQIRVLGLDCMELAWVRSVRIGQKKAQKIAQVARENNVVLSVHAPYYINLNSAEPDKVKASRERILAAARAGFWAGARNIVFHPAFYHDDPPEVVYERVKEHLQEIGEQLREEGVEVVLRPETTGKPTQFGSLEELIQLSRELEGVQPCVDFAHLHARALGKLNSYEEFADILRLLAAGLGPEALKDMHIHVSGIEYGPHGEREHLNLKDADLRYEELLQALKDFGVAGTLVCESPDQEGDALLLQKSYRRL